eukprot:scaffold1636_cov239-Prasinococcus_capsulatus_cf.AAC.2
MGATIAPITCVRVATAPLMRRLRQLGCRYSEQASKICARVFDPTEGRLDKARRAVDACHLDMTRVRRWWKRRQSLMRLPTRDEAHVVASSRFTTRAACRAAHAK